VGDGIFILLFSPRPKTLHKADVYGLHKRLVRVILKELTEFFNIYVASYLNSLGCAQIDSFATKFQISD
jgi:hypothetical protein